MPHDATGSVIGFVVDYYTSKLTQHGTTPQGVDWNGEASHELRHHQFLRLLEAAPEASVLDLGCGFGDFLRFLRARGHRGDFIGYDIAPGMIEQASRLHAADAASRWRIGAKPQETADFAIASGIFNVKGKVSADVWNDYVHETIEVLAKAGRSGFAFNMLSLSSDPERRRANLHYADAPTMLAYCLRHYGRSVALLQDYGLYEFTVIVRRT